ncbi:unnamed protein product [Vitrella brassicaformis CCMP3155]|uniref:Uncharacterized protein n=2 Tax=Vitrella brassicaformis TaxID=1169539 RepID=A0A0G4F196_VITBC|nr:unnamed protein product [Vitrella brassicaformis CCMP3155]|eukprot:CEM05148.1 unnamed protein product [Vitrella brassicaformis CCMP3155]
MQTTPFSNLVNHNVVQPQNPPPPPQLKVLLNRIDAKTFESGHYYDLDGSSRHRAYRAARIEAEGKWAWLCVPEMRHRAGVSVAVWDTSGVHLLHWWEEIGVGASGGRSTDASCVYPIVVDKGGGRPHRTMVALMARPGEKLTAFLTEIPDSHPVCGTIVPSHASAVISLAKDEHDVPAFVAGVGSESEQGTATFVVAMLSGRMATVRVTIDPDAAPLVASLHFSHEWSTGDKIHDISASSPGGIYGLAYSAASAAASTPVRVVNWGLSRLFKTPGPMRDDEQNQTVSQVAVTARHGHEDFTCAVLTSSSIQLWHHHSLTGAKKLLWRSEWCAGLQDDHPLLLPIAMAFTHPYVTGPPSIVVLAVRIGGDWQRTLLIRTGILSSTGVQWREPVTIADLTPHPLPITNTDPLAIITAPLQPPPPPEPPMSLPPLLGLFHLAAIGTAGRVHVTAPSTVVHEVGDYVTYTYHLADDQSGGLHGPHLTTHPANELVLATAAIQQDIYVVGKGMVGLLQEHSLYGRPLAAIDRGRETSRDTEEVARRHLQQQQQQQRERPQRFSPYSVPVLPARETPSPTMPAAATPSPPRALASTAGSAQCEELICCVLQGMMVRQREMRGERMELQTTWGAPERIGDVEIAVRGVADVLANGWAEEAREAVKGPLIQQAVEHLGNVDTVKRGLYDRGDLLQGLVQVLKETGLFNKLSSSTKLELSRHLEQLSFAVKLWDLRSARPQLDTILQHSGTSSDPTRPFHRLKAVIRVLPAIATHLTNTAATHGPSIEAYTEINMVLHELLAFVQEKRATIAHLLGLASEPESAGAFPLSDGFLAPPWLVEGDARRALERVTDVHSPMVSTLRREGAVTAHAHGRREALQTYLISLMHLSDHVLNLFRQSPQAIRRDGENALEELKERFIRPCEDLEVALEEALMGVPGDYPVFHGSKPGTWGLALRYRHTRAVIHLFGRRDPRGLLAQIRDSREDDRERLLRTVACVYPQLLEQLVLESEVGMLREAASLADSAGGGSEWLWAAIVKLQALEAAKEDSRGQGFFAHNSWTALDEQPLDEELKGQLTRGEDDTVAGTYIEASHKALDECAATMVDHEALEGVYCLQSLALPPHIDQHEAADALGWKIEQLTRTRQSKEQAPPATGSPGRGGRGAVMEADLLKDAIRAIQAAVQRDIRRHTDAQAEITPDFADPKYQPYAGFARNRMIRLVRLLKRVAATAGAVTRAALTEYWLYVNEIDREYWVKVLTALSHTQHRSIGDVDLKPFKTRQSIIASGHDILDDQQTEEERRETAAANYAADEITKTLTYELLATHGTDAVGWGVGLEDTVREGVRCRVGEEGVNRLYYELGALAEATVRKSRGFSADTIS